MARALLFGAGGLPGDHIDADARQVGEYVERRSIEHDRLFARLAVGQEQHAALEIHMFPPQSAGFREAERPSGSVAASPPRRGDQ
jgi:hypothetical protein